MEQEKEQSIIRSVLRSEVTWVVSLVMAVWGFVVTVVLPLQSLQFQIAQVQKDITQTINSGNDLNLRLTALEQATAILNSRITENQKKLNNF